jgi:N-methylhydantoinase B
MLDLEESCSMKSDKLTVEVVKHSLAYMSEEMGVALRKSAYSPNIRERADHSCAILDDEGRTIGQAEHIPVHIGSFSLGLKNTLAFLDKTDVKISMGDMFIVNDPYISGTHLNDVTLIRPVFVHDDLIGYAANKAHHVDVGGKTPASINPFARDLAEEGIAIQPTKLMEKDILNSGVVETLSNSSRMPETTQGDLRAQIAANLLGERRLTELVSRLSRKAFNAASEDLLSQTYQLACTEYGKMPKGTWTGKDYLELDDALITICEAVTIHSDAVEVDFDGTDAQVQAPLNAVLGVTTAAVTFTLKTLMPSDLPLNDGFNRTIHIVAPEGTVVNPRRPAPVAAGNLETSQRIVDVTYQALSSAMPDRVPASSHGSMNNLMMGGVNPISRKAWAFYETIGGGCGARPGMDGADSIQVNMTNTLNTPIEVMEHYYPIQFASYRIRDGSGGAGEWRGGMGIERCITAKSRVEIALLGDRHKIPPPGLKGGLPGKTSEYLVARSTGGHVPLKSKDATVLEAGDTLIVRTAGGGGYGEPRKRKASLVKKDLEDEYITREYAARVYPKS